MDAVKFVKTLGRMCNAECIRCEFWKRKSGGESCNSWQKANPEEAVAIVEQWAAEHPIKTRQSEFLKQWPKADVDENGVLQTCPALISASHRDQTGGCATQNRSCDDCRKEFWGLWAEAALETKKDE